MRKTIVLFTLFSSLSFAASFKQVLFRASQVALIAANAVDVSSSYGRVELNPVLRSADGRFGGRGIAIKSGITAGLVISGEMFKRQRTTWTVINFAGAGLLGGVAARNYGLSSRGQRP